MPRAPKKCTVDGCVEKQVRFSKCNRHQPERVPWENKPDRPFLKTSRWRNQSIRVVREYNNNRGGCALKLPGCLTYATHADHILPVWYTGVEEVSDDELQGLCESCHAKKTSRDAYYAKRAKWQKKG